MISGAYLDSGEDKYVGRQVNINRALEFKDCLDSCNMIDLGFIGPRFTWTNKSPISNLILEKIDICFANPDWRIMYPEATITHLPWTYSDHCPVLVDLFKPPLDASNRPFHFQTMWLLHPEFLTVVQSAWAESIGLLEATMNFTVRAKRWNSNVFGIVFMRKKMVLAIINETQKALANSPNEFLI